MLTTFSRVFRALGPVDLRNVGRDAMLKWMVVIPPPVALMVRWGVPALADWLLAAYDFDLAPYSQLFVTYFVVLMTGSMYGMVIGFLLLDERDDRTLTALQVTPMPLTAYLFYRMAVPVVLSVVMTVIAYWMTGLAPLPFGALLLVAVVGALFAPTFALLMVAFANNKVEGFAIMKSVGGVALLPPIGAYFIPMPWQLLTGILPTYWPAKLTWALLANDPNAWVYAVVGVVYMLALNGWFIRRFERVMHGG